jgi:hypothetical protein
MSVYRHWCLRSMEHLGKRKAMLCTRRTIIAENMSNVLNSWISQDVTAQIKDMPILMFAEPCVLCDDTVWYFVCLFNCEVSIEQNADEIVEQLSSVKIPDDTKLSRCVGWIKATARDLKFFFMALVAS